MSSSRKIIAEFVGVFLIGALAGGLVVWFHDDQPLTEAMSHWNNPDTLEARIDKKYADDYHLTDDEMARIQPLTKQMTQDLYKTRHQFGVDIIDTLDRYHTEIAAQLTPEHRAVYEANMADRRNKLSALLLSDQSSPSPAQK
jgi:uncharacterized membrane protein